MRSRVLSIFFVLCILFCLSGAATAEPAVLVEKVPEWNIGDTWRFRAEKKLDRTVTQDAGILKITMRIEKIESEMTYAVTGTARVQGDECYVVSVRGASKITGSYNVMQVQGDFSRGEFVQNSEVEGTECRRVGDLAFVKADLRSLGSIRLSGMLGGIATPYESREITIADPPARLLKFPLVEGDKWRVASTLTTSSSGTSAGSAITTFNYECEVLGRRSTTLESGESYDSVAISQKGTQTIQLQDSGVNIEDVDGVLFFAPSIGNRVRDDAEGEQLLEFIAGSRAPAQPADESIELAPDASATH